MSIPLTENKIILITRKTRLDDLIKRYNSISQAKFYIEKMCGDFDDYTQEHEKYYLALNKVKDTLNELGRLQVIDKSFLPNFIFSKKDIIVTLGQDGLVANTLKYLNGQPLIGVNPDKKRWDGILLPFDNNNLALIVKDVFRNIYKIKEVAMAEAKLNDGQSLLAVNDLFIGQKTHISSRYVIEIEDKREYQSSSGIIISTGLGSTGWLKSVIKGAEQIYNNLHTRDLKLVINKKITWNSNYLYYSVREPFPSRTTGTSLVFGKITKQKGLKIYSKMPENGVIFSDGIENDFVNFNSGVIADISLSEKKGILVC